MKDTFLTVSYKDGYIHSCHNRETGEEEIEAQFGNDVINCNTYAGAKRLITKLMKEAV